MLIIAFTRFNVIYFDLAQSDYIMLQLEHDILFPWFENCNSNPDLGQFKCITLYALDNELVRTQCCKWEAENKNYCHQVQTIKKETVISAIALIQDNYEAVIIVTERHWKKYQSLKNNIQFDSEEKCRSRYDDFRQLQPVSVQSTMSMYAQD